MDNCCNFIGLMHRFPMPALPQALAECGMDELAKEARRKLAAVKAGTEAEPADVEYEPCASDDGEEEEEEEWSPRRRR